jgi:hypothetical protein
VRGGIAGMVATGARVDRRQTRWARSEGPNVAAEGRSSRRERG